MSRRRDLEAVLLDLDGTLLDTATDMAAALNQLRRDEGLEPLPFAAVRPQVSNGSAGLLELGFGQLEPGPFELLRSRFLAHYRRGLAEQTRLFDGFDEVLTAIEAAGMRWGIVTNKPGWLTDPLLAALGLAARSSCTVSGDTLAERKPHPLPLLYAAACLGLPAERCVYVGDAERDVQAAHGAGMMALVAGYGYLGADDDPASWQPAAVLERPSDLLAWLGL
ncbi:MAG: HAD family hydrolase [Gammaproteobacteria bacterium]|nr:MAG: HAD family hydrolase [Gammaproteobacteria bacterium]